MFTRSRQTQRPGPVPPPVVPLQESAQSCSEAGRAARSVPDTRLDRIGIFWTGMGATAPTDPFRRSGKYVATTTWTDALARHTTAGAVDIFAPVTQMGSCHRQFEGTPEVAYGSERATAHLLPESELPDRLRTHTYDVLHSPEGLVLTEPSYIRSRFARRILPITCSQMGISYAFDLYNAFVRLLTAQIYPCDAIVCSTVASRLAMERRLGDIAEQYARAWERPAPPLPRLELIPWGVDTQRFAPRDMIAARRDFDLPTERPILLCVARFRVEDKMDLTPLLLALDRISRTTNKRPVLVLAGSCLSDYSEHVLSQAKQLGLRDSVRTFLNLPPACLPTLYATCDVFVSPTDSPSESFGLTIIEAMACGRPVVASDWDGYRELIVHGETGFKVRTDWVDCLGDLNELAPALMWDQQHLHVGQSVNIDVAEMARYLGLLLENRELREEMGRRGRSRVETLYHWPVVIRQWEAMWEELIGVARSITQPERDRLDYLRPNYFQHFAHYASRIVGAETPVSITGRGKELLAGNGPLLLHPWARGFLREECFHAALAALNVAARLGGGLSLADLVKCVCKAHGCRDVRALMHVMWLAKYDLVCLGGAERATDEGGPGSGNGR